MVAVPHRCVSEAETTRKKQTAWGWVRKAEHFTKNSSLISLQGRLSSTGLVNRKCFYLCQNSMNDMNLYFLKYYCLYVVGTCILLNIKDCCYIFRFPLFSASNLYLQSSFTLYWLHNCSSITIFQQTKLWVSTVVTAYPMLHLLLGALTTDGCGQIIWPPMCQYSCRMKCTVSQLAVLQDLQLNYNKSDSTA